MCLFRSRYTWTISSSWAEASSALQQYASLKFIHFLSCVEAPSDLFPANNHLIQFYLKLFFLYLPPCNKMSSVSKSSKRGQGVMVAFSSGAVSAMASTLMFQPLDLVKTRMQSRVLIPSAVTPVYL